MVSLVTQHPSTITLTGRSQVCPPARWLRCELLGLRPKFNVWRWAGLLWYQRSRRCALRYRWYWWRRETLPKSILLRWLSETCRLRLELRLEAGHLWLQLLWLLLLLETNLVLLLERLLRLELIYAVRLLLLLLLEAGGLRLKSRWKHGINASLLWAELLLLEACGL